MKLHGPLVAEISAGKSSSQLRQAQAINQRSSNFQASTRTLHQTHASPAPTHEPHSRDIRHLSSNGCATISAAIACEAANAGRNTAACESYTLLAYSCAALRRPSPWRFDTSPSAATARLNASSLPRNFPCHGPQYPQSYRIACGGNSAPQDPRYGRGRHLHPRSQV